MVNEDDLDSDPSKLSVFSSLWSLVLAISTYLKLILVLNMLTRRNNSIPGRPARQIRSERLADAGDPERDGDQLLLAAARRDGQHREGRAVLRGVRQAVQLPQGDSYVHIYNLTDGNGTR